ncbi:hypothetical protein OPT61_g8594 [Boeremia exigua]|uniref:Uncharacterized protein n=1 Tax=Boeremia exigua TaxID=749465 RepID=A0ACC2HYG1_9PLEO|nr:hypothetical protein OPT61_g8594 [Boeremia exigua]
MASPDWDASIVEPDSPASKSSCSNDPPIAFPHPAPAFLPAVMTVSAAMRQSSAVTRSFSGCRRCREKKVKCDEAHPRCRRCVRQDYECDYRRRPRKQYVRRATVKANPSTAAIATAEGNKESITSFNHHEQASTQGPAPPALASTTAPTSASGPASPHAPESAPISAYTTPQSPGHSIVAQYSHNSPSQGSPAASLQLTELAPQCRDILLPFDDLAIRFFCSFFPAEGDTKAPEYSGPYVVWMLAQNSPMVLHMVCALGGQKWCAHNTSLPETSIRQSQAFEHYGAALSLILAISQQRSPASVSERNLDYLSAPTSPNLDSILATFWLMVLYELKFGDGCGFGLDTHLQGVALVIQGWLHPLHLGCDSMDIGMDGLELDSSHDSLGVSFGPQQELLSPVSCTIMVWLALLDGGAVINGFGGAFSELLGQAVPREAHDPVRLHLRCLRTLQQRSSLVNAQIWGHAYPQHYLIEDMQNAQLSCFYAESGQLRYLLGKLSTAEEVVGGSDITFRKSVATGIRLVGSRYQELIKVARQLESPREGFHSQFVAMIRFVVSFYHAVVLCFLRITRGNKPLNAKQREALASIMFFAFKTLRDKGEAAMTRLAWPLIVAILESDDVVHRTWIFERFEGLAKRGENYRRALVALRTAFSEQDLDERKIAYGDLFRREHIGRAERSGVRETSNRHELAESPELAGFAELGEDQAVQVETTLVRMLGLIIRIFGLTPPDDKISFPHGARLVRPGAEPTN